MRLFSFSECFSFPNPGSLYRTMRSPFANLFFYQIEINNNESFIHTFIPMQAIFQKEAVMDQSGIISPGCFCVPSVHWKAGIDSTDSEWEMLVSSIMCYFGPGVNIGVISWCHIRPPQYKDMEPGSLETPGRRCATLATITARSPSFIYRLMRLEFGVCIFSRCPCGFTPGISGFLVQSINMHVWRFGDLNQCPWMCSMWLV